ncbi:MAG: ATP-binding cassette domain-containing protein [Calditrichaeota bacterium]|nr:ATP-binding cassette domain-containing protein [Calditrichota bacterium]
MILDDVNLCWNDGEVLTIIGKSGTGKSVLLKSIIGLIKPDSGTVTMDGQVISDFSENEYNLHVRNQMSMVFQEGALWDSMTVGENVELALRIHKHLSDDERKKIVSETLEMVGLRHIENEYPEDLSGGMVKRVAIARAVATRPRYMLYDEPTTGLDPVLSNVINSLIAQLNRDLNVSSLIISHDIKSIQKISDRIAMLYQGNIIHTCSAKDIWNQNNDIFNEFIHGKVEFL